MQIYRYAVTVTAGLPESFLFLRAKEISHYPLEERGFFMPIKTIEAGVATDFPFSKQDGRDTAQFVDDLLRKRRRYIARPSADRILPSAEPQTTRFPSSGSIDFGEDLRRIDQLHARLEITEGLRMAHDPAVDRARYERGKTDAERESVRQGVIEDNQKLLYERARTAESTVVYYQNSEGKIYNPKFPGESFDVVLQRGLAYSKKKGFVDYEREVEEYKGWEKVMTGLFDPQVPLQSKAIVISGPGLKRGTAFTDNFVDIFTKTIDTETGNIVVVMTRFASGANYEEYKQIAARFNVDYFSSKEAVDDKNIDLYFKRNPIYIDYTDTRSAQQIFEAEFKKQKGATEEEKTRSYIEGCKLFILHYADTICAKFFDPKAVEQAYKAVINKFDSLRESIVENIIRRGSGFGKDIADQGIRVLKSFQEELKHFGGMAVKAMMLGCGFSGDFSTRGIGEQINGLTSSVVRGISSLFSKDKDFCIRCGACGKEIRCIVRKDERCPRSSCKAVRRC